jgi:ribosomal protein L31E
VKARAATVTAAIKKNQRRAFDTHPFCTTSMKLSPKCPRQISSKGDRAVPRKVSLPPRSMLEDFAPEISRGGHNGERQPSKGLIQINGIRALPPKMAHGN